MPEFVLDHVRNWSVRLEFEPRDLWLGAYWKRTPIFKQIDVWVCLVPMLPLHFSYRGLTLRITSAYRSAEDARHIKEWSRARSPHQPGSHMTEAGRRIHERWRRDHA